MLSLNDVEPIGPETIQTTQDWLNPEGVWWRGVAFHLVDGLTLGFFAERDKLRKQYNDGAISYAEYEQRTLQRALAHTAGFALSFAVGGPIFTMARTVGGTIAASGAVSAVASAAIGEELIQKILGSAYEEVKRGDVTWEEVLGRTLAMEAEVFLGAFFTPGQTKAMTQEAVAGIKNILSVLAESLSSTPGKIALVGGAVAAGDAEAAGPKKPRLYEKVNNLQGTLDPRGGSVVKFRRIGQTADAVLFTAPKAQSATLIEAAQWYRQQYGKISTWIDPKASPGQQYVQFVKFNEILLKSAKNSLYAKGSGIELQQLSPFDRTTLRAWADQIHATGQVKQKLLLKRLKEHDVNAQKEFDVAPGCFAAGTLVHTKEGLVPIEKIKVGDWVLSKHESGQGEREYKRVVQTFVHGEQEVMGVLFGDQPQDGPAWCDVVLATLNHPFWTEGKGWVEARTFLDRKSRRSKFEVLSPAAAYTYASGQAYVTDEPHLVWTPTEYGSSANTGSGNVVDLDTAAYVWGEEPDGTRRPRGGTWPVFCRSGADAVRFPTRKYLYRCKVYNLEVEDYHTYYVGQQGVWVHNSNLKVGENGIGAIHTLDPRVRTDRIFSTQGDLENFIKYYAGADKAQVGDIFIIKSGFTSQGKLRGETSPYASDLFDAQAPGALTAKVPVGEKSDIRTAAYEYAVVFRDGRDPLQPLNFFRTEGMLNADIAVDMKLNLVKHDDIKGLLDFLYTRAKWMADTDALNPAGVKKKLELWMWPLKNGTGDAEARLAKVDLDKVKNAQDGYFFGADNPLGPNAEEQARNALIQRMVGQERFDVKAAPLAARDAVEKVRPRNQETQAQGTQLLGTLLQASDVEALLPVARQYWLNQGARASVLNGVQVSIGQLPAAIAGQTQGNSVTLSADGAGWGWYVDSTPMADEEFTADLSAQNWRAVAGSAAAGKLDLLTVLIHELGHVLGAQDLTRAEDVMSGHLEAGVRRLPTAQDVAQWLTAQQFRAESANSVAGFAVRVGSLTISGTPPTVVNTVPASISPTLQDWATQGSVVTSSVSGGTPTGATLSENSSTQTRLNQVFMVGPQDRFLSFTLSNLALDDATNGPDDAFEAALLNANTGADLLSPLSLSHTDALLNLQAGNNGLAELVAQGVTHVTHADGSRTYLVDLSGIARDADGKVAVNLSFDLIGFGTTAATMGSHVQVSDVRLLGSVQTVDDSATGAEDSVLTIDALANDLGINPSGPNGQTSSTFTPVVVAGPAHGTVSANADGSFSYSPDANYFGADSFTYQVTNGVGAGRLSGCLQQFHHVRQT